MLTGLVLSLAAGLLLEGCRGPTRPAVAVGGEAPGSALGIVVESGVLQSQTGCDFDYDLYRPAGMTSSAQVVLAHGFLRSRERMQGLARALAEAGFVTVAIDLCNMRPWDGAHELNAADMRLTARSLGSAGVVYAGFSAGGLAALLAASGDPHSHGVVVLDLVDQDDLGRRAAVALDKPVSGLFGRRSRCNANGNGLVVLADAVDAKVEQFDNATHCDFESPTDDLCRLLCEPSGRDPDEAAVVRARLITSAVAAVQRVSQLARRSPVATPVD